MTNDSARDAAGAANAAAAEAAQVADVTADGSVAAADGTFEAPAEGEQEAQPEEPAAPPLQVADVFTAAPGNQKILMSTMEACRQPRTPTELDAVMLDLLAHNRSVFRPVELRALLERYNAIRYEPSEDEQAAREAQEAQDAGEDVEVQVDEDGYLVVTPPAEGTWNLTEAGAAYLDSDPLGVYLSALMAKDAVYVPVYLKLLEFVAEQPRTKREIDAVVDVHPLVQNPRLYSGYFLGELEKADVMEWADAWQITARGRDLLDALHVMQAEGSN